MWPPARGSVCVYVCVCVLCGWLLQVAARRHEMEDERYGGGTRRRRHRRSPRCCAAYNVCNEESVTNSNVRRFARGYKRMPAIVPPHTISTLGVFPTSTTTAPTRIRTKSHTDTSRSPNVITHVLCALSPSHIRLLPLLDPAARRLERHRQMRLRARVPPVINRVIRLEEAP